MKKSMFLVPLAALGLLASCAETGTSTSTPTTPTVTPATFAQQCEEAGVEFTYVDPNAGITEAETKPAAGEEDCVAATGTKETSYTAEKGGSYYTYKYMVERSGLKYFHYYWAEPDEKTTAATATTITEAAALDNAEYVTELFPNDGKEYYVASYSNSLATKTFVAVGLEGNIQTAIYNTTAKYDEATNVATWTPGITSISGIGNAILESGKCNIVMYEYNPTSSDKVGPGARNFGARMECVLNLEKSTLQLTDKTTLTGAEIGEIGDKLPENGSYFRPCLEVVKMYSLG